MPRKNSNPASVRTHFTIDTKKICTTITYRKNNTNSTKLCLGPFFRFKILYFCRFTLFLPIPATAHKSKKNKKIPGLAHLLLYHKGSKTTLISFLLKRRPIPPQGRSSFFCPKPSNSKNSGQKFQPKDFFAVCTLQQRQLKCVPCGRRRLARQ